MLSVAALALGGGRVQAAQAPKVDAYVSPGLLAKAEENPAALFDVIVQARENGKSSDVAAEIADVRKSDPASGTKLKRQFVSIAGTSATPNGRQLLKLAKRGWVESVVEDARTGATYSNSQKRVGATEELESATNPWTASYSYPAIAIVDSGVQPRTDFGKRLKAQVSFVSTGNSSGDGFGHGTMVAALAAGSAESYTGFAPKANIVSLDVLNDLGVGSMGDAIAACDWILANKAQDNIRVANFSVTPARARASSSTRSTGRSRNCG